MARFPSARIPQKQGSVAGRRQFFRNEGASEAGAPGTKRELRTSKHRVAAVRTERGTTFRTIRNANVGTKCGSSNGHGSTCIRKKGHDGGHASKGNAWG